VLSTLRPRVSSRALALATQWNDRGRLLIKLLGLDFVDEDEGGIDAPFSPLKITPLHAAVMGGKIEAVRILLQHGADPTKSDSQGRDARTLSGLVANGQKILRVLDEHMNEKAT